MQLVDYLIALDGDRRSQAPDKLVLPEQFVAELGKLYTTAERKGREHGCAVFCDRGSRTLSYGTIAEGLPTSVQIPASTHVNNFGDVHAHPSASIGHTGGHSSHSMLDLLKFANTRTKPYFFQFVVAGPRMYAMVQVGTVSDWSDAVACSLTQLNADEEGQMRAAVVAAAGGEHAYDARVNALGTFPSEAAYGALMTELKGQAKMGELMQTLSMKNCTTFAKTHHYVFYAGQDVFLTRMV